MLVNINNKQQQGGGGNLNSQLVAFFGEAPLNLLGQSELLGIIKGPRERAGEASLENSSYLVDERQVLDQKKRFMNRLGIRSLIQAAWGVNEDGSSYEVTRHFREEALEELAQRLTPYAGNMTEEFLTEFAEWGCQIPARWEDLSEPKQLGAMWIPPDIRGLLRSKRMQFFPQAAHWFVQARHDGELLLDAGEVVGLVEDGRFCVKSRDETQVMFNMRLDIFCHGVDIGLVHAESQVYETYPECRVVWRVGEDTLIMARPEMGNFCLRIRPEGLRYSVTIGLAKDREGIIARLKQSVVSPSSDKPFKLPSTLDLPEEDYMDIQAKEVKLPIDNYSQRRKIIPYPEEAASRVVISVENKQYHWEEAVISISKTPYLVEDVKNRLINSTLILAVHGDVRRPAVLQFTDLTWMKQGITIDMVNEYVLKMYPGLQKWGGRDYQLGVWKTFGGEEEDLTFRQRKKRYPWLLLVPFLTSEGVQTLEAIPNRQVGMFHPPWKKTPERVFWPRLVRGVEMIREYHWASGVPQIRKKTMEYWGVSWDIFEVMLFDKEACWLIARSFEGIRVKIFATEYESAEKLSFVPG